MGILRGIIATPFLVIGALLALFVALPVIGAWVFFNTGQIISGRELLDVKGKIKIDV